MTNKRELVGVVVSSTNDKTISVKVETYKKHPKYGKRVKYSKKYTAHDENNQAKVGDIVRVVETKPLSKTKRLSLQIIEDQEIKKQEINITSEFKKVSYDLDSLFNEEEKSFKEVENIQQKIKSFKDNLASKYGESK